MAFGRKKRKEGDFCRCIWILKIPNSLLEIQFKTNKQATTHTHTAQNSTQSAKTVSDLISQICQDVWDDLKFWEENVL